MKMHALTSLAATKTKDTWTHHGHAAILAVAAVAEREIRSAGPSPALLPAGRFTG
ncbi:hypothetical protein StoSoilB20_29000 [Arthrobacter sp. StoSoilB20]|nr:hypothetical protein StoSoilB20_29000 [Arthrobacter sp. StoSoilB20]